MKSILVTGGAGFIGCNLVRRLLEQHGRYEVTVLDACVYPGDKSNLRDCCGDAMFEFIKGDICDMALLESVMCDADVVINAAAFTDVYGGMESSCELVRSNVDGVRVLAESAIRHHIKKFVQVSTYEAYGTAASGTNSEESLLRPGSPYGATKAAGDLLVLAYANMYGLAATVVRGGNTYGPFEHPEKMVGGFITGAIEEKHIPVYGDGQHVRDWLYVDDHCDGIIAAMEKGRPGSIYNIVSGEQITNLEMARKILGMMNRSESMLELVPDKRGHDRRHAADSGKAREELGWHHKVDLDDGLRQTIDWYTRNRSWWETRKREAAAV